MSVKQKVIIIGAGVGGLATACLLAKAGYKVTIFEKNEQAGGMAGMFSRKGFTFDAGPSWILMKDVFERFYAELDEKLEDHLDLVRLDPSYKVFFKDTDKTANICSDARDFETFEDIEPGSAKQLRKYLGKSRQLYEVASKHFLYTNRISLWSLISPNVLFVGLRSGIFSRMEIFAKKHFKSELLQKIVTYPSVFLGGSPYNTPTLYNLLNHTIFEHGVFYPKGGLYKLVDSLLSIGKEYGVEIVYNAPVEKILTSENRAIGIKVGSRNMLADVVISNADRHFTETTLLDASERDHKEKYWNKLVVAPSALLMYLGVDRQYDSIQHHNLVFCQDWRQNFSDIFDDPRMPRDPSFYVCAPSKTDSTVAPEGHENLFVLVPIAAGLEYTARELANYTQKILACMEKEMGLASLRKHIVYQKSFCVKDFENRYNSFRGTGLGLAHTFKQSATFRPSNRSRKVKGLYFVGADTHPGIGLPACLISAELVAKRLIPTPSEKHGKQQRRSLRAR